MSNPEGQKAPYSKLRLLRHCVSSEFLSTPMCTLTLYTTVSVYKPQVVLKRTSSSYVSSLLERVKGRQGGWKKEGVPISSEASLSLIA